MFTIKMTKIHSLKNFSEVFSKIPMLTPMQILINDHCYLDNQYTPSDVKALVQWLNDPVIFANTLKIPSPYTEADGEHFLNLVEDRGNVHGVPVNWAIREKSGLLIGGLGRFCETGPKGHRDEIGYWLAEPYRGKGLMPEIVKTYCQYLFDTTPLVRIYAQVFDYNPASARVLEKVGFRYEGLLRNYHKKGEHYLNALSFSLLKGEL
jgi:[ribosomal protein S5]-alanine N-acetyltransferase